jgi:hypothetical protein
LGVNGAGDAGKAGGEAAGGEGRDGEGNRGAGGEGGSSGFGHGDIEAEAAGVFEAEEGGVGIGSDECAGVDEALGDDAIKGRGDAEILLHLAGDGEGGLGSVDGGLGGIDGGEGSIELAARLKEVRFGDDAFGGGSGFEVIVGKLGAVAARGGFGEAGAGEADFGFRLSHLEGEFGGGEGDEGVAFFDDGAFVDEDEVDEGREAGMEDDGFEGEQFAGEGDEAVEGARQDGSEFGADGLGSGEGGSKEQEQGEEGAAH